MGKLYFYKRTHLLGQNSTLASASKGKWDVGEHVLVGAMKRLLCKCQMGLRGSLV